MPRFTLPAIAGPLLFVITACAGGAVATDQPTAPAQTPVVPISSGSLPSPMPTAASPGTITIKNFEFMPARLTVHVGETVTWTNEENSLHTVTSGTPDARTGLFDSGEFDTGDAFEFTFAEVGTYAFFCDRHEFMRGEVIVVP